MNKIQKTEVDNIIIPFTDIGGKDCYVSVTEWANGEGYDISIEDGNVQTIQLHMDSLNALNVAIGMLQLNINGE